MPHVLLSLRGYVMDTSADSDCVCQLVLTAAHVEHNYMTTCTASDARSEGEGEELGLMDPEQRPPGRFQFCLQWQQSACTATKIQNCLVFSYHSVDW